MKIKKFTSLFELLLSKEFKNKDLSYCDLSGIHLSILPTITWKNFKFYHTNFANTGIRFYPKKLYKNSKEYKIQDFYSIEYCDFTNCNLSYLTTSDLAFTSIKGCNFTNTNLNVELYTGFGKDVNSDDEGLGYKDYSDIVFPKNGNMVETIKKIAFLSDYKIIIDNPNIPFSSECIYLLLKKELSKKCRYYSSSKICEFNEFIDMMLQEDEKREGNLVKFFNILNDNKPFTDSGRIQFFQGYVGVKGFSLIDLSTIPSELIKLVDFNHCSFEKIIFPPSFELNCKGWHLDSKNIGNVYFPTMTPESWQTFKDTRLMNSAFTFHRNLYLELGRGCNGSCNFCRNQYLEPCKYNLENIKKNLVQLLPYLDNVVIGGGEPTLLLDDIYNLKKFLKDNHEKKKPIIFTNGSLSLEQLMDMRLGFYLNISRHSVSDSVNNEILGVKSLNISELKKLFEHYIGGTLCATCFKGDGLDSVEKIEDYIVFSKECGVSSVLLQTLHKDLKDINETREVLPIEDEIFDEVIIKLKEQGYKMSLPIYSTGDYKLIIARKNNHTISFKKYITPEELEREWYQACKRTFDLSMDPSGNVYQNWHQSSGKVLLKSQDTDR